MAHGTSGGLLGLNQNHMDAPDRLQLYLWRLTNQSSTPPAEGGGGDEGAMSGEFATSFWRGIMPRQT